MKPFAFLIVLAVGGLLSPPAADAELTKKIYRVGALNGSTPAQTTHMFRAFSEGLRENGFVEGENVVIEYRWAEGKLERLPGFATELVNLKVDVIFAPPTPAAVAARNATKTIPIVFALAADPIGNGLIESLARPGGNATGMSTINVELGAKRLELLKEAFPKISRVAVVYNPADTSNQLQLKVSLEAAKVLGVTLVPIGVQRREDLEPAFATATKERTDAIFVMENPLNFTIRQQVVSLVQQSRLPAIYSLREFVDARPSLRVGQQQMRKSADSQGDAAAHEPFTVAQCEHHVVGRHLCGQPGLLAPVEEFEARQPVFVGLPGADGLVLTVDEHEALRPEFAVVARGESGEHEQEQEGGDRCAEDAIAAFEPIDAGAEVERWIERGHGATG